MIIRNLKLTFLAVCMVVGFLFTEDKSSASLSARFLKGTDLPMIPHPGKLIDRIYYINLPKSVERNAYQKSWTSKLSIPVQRVEAQEGRTDLCAQLVGPKKCVGASGLVMTNLHILKDLNVSGVSLVIEDDYQITDMEKLEYAFHKYIPDDWDVVRLDCWQGGNKGAEVEYIHKPFVFKFKGVGTFFGGTHGYIFRESSAPKLYELWSQQPYQEVDWRLNTDKLNSYCLGTTRSVTYGTFNRTLSRKTTIFKGKG